MGEMVAIHTGYKLMNAPLINPKKIANVMIAASLLEGVQYARIEIDIIVDAMVCMLNGPNLSLMNPGIIRPNTEAALVIEMR
jgi:hypothetical protein